LSQEIAELSEEIVVESALYSLMRFRPGSVGRMNLPVRFDILLVDDSPTDAEVFKLALKEVSPRVNLYWVASGQEALDFVQEQGRFAAIGPVKLIILDVQLPRIDGFEVLLRIRQGLNRRRLPIIFFSTSKSKQDVNRAYSLGANAYFTKPMSLEQYMEKTRIIVQHWLDFAELPESENSADSAAPTRGPEGPPSSS
jgi:two-component system, chemotaxis family, response regulator Rcp1